MQRHPRSLVVLGAIPLLSAGCAERGVASRPDAPPGAGTWVLVGVAVGLAVVVLATLIGGVGRGRWTAAVGVLSFQAASVVVGGAVLAGLAIASWPLADAKASGTLEVATSLVRISVTDGDPRYYTLMLGVVAVLGPLLALLLGITARFAGGADPIERAAASTVLLLELVPATYGLLRLVQGHPTALAMLGAAHLPILALAIRSAWPRRSVAPSEAGDQA